jgi:uncharacterized protein YdhG (YjbR/CyaY superfamily)
MPETKPSSVDEYIAAAPTDAQDKLHELRAILKDVAPEATEALKWGSPVLEQKRILFAYSAFRTHLNFMPTRTSIEPFRDALADYSVGRDTIQLPYDKPLPEELIRKIAAHRLRDVLENDARWM